MSAHCERAWRKFHAENPHVYEHLHRLALKMAGVRWVLSISLIWEVMRWELMFTTHGEKMVNPDTGEPFKLNNNHRAYYARLLMDSDPRLADRFRIRTVGLADRDDDGVSMLNAGRAAAGLDLDDEMG